MESEITNKDSDLRLLLTKGQTLVDTASPMSDVSDLSDRLDSIKSEYGKIKRKSSQKKDKFKECNKMANKFQGDLDLLSAWLQLNEEKVTAMPPVGLKKNIIAKQLKDAQVRSISE